MGKKEVEEKKEENKDQKQNNYTKQARRGRPKEQEKVPKIKNISKKHDQKKQFLKQEQPEGKIIQNQQLKNPKTQQNTAQGFFIDFHEEIGDSKGFNFKKEQRAELIKESTEVKWHQDDDWDYDQQQEKLSQLIKAAKLENQNSTQKMRSIISFVGYIFAAQVTQQIYRVLIKLWGIRMKKHQIDFLGFPKSQKEQETKKLIQNILLNQNNNYKFLSYNFSKKYTVSNKTIRVELQKLINNLANLFDEVIKNSQTGQMMIPQNNPI